MLDVYNSIKKKKRKKLLLVILVITIKGKKKKKKHTQTISKHTVSRKQSKTILNKTLG